MGHKVLTKRTNVKELFCDDDNKPRKSFISMQE
jgi:hypothetical protein